MPFPTPVCSSHPEMYATHRVQGWGPDARMRWLYLCPACTVEMERGAAWSVEIVALDEP